MFAIALIKIGRNAGKEKGKHKEVVVERRKSRKIFLTRKKESRENHQEIGRAPKPDT